MKRGIDAMLGALQLGLSALLLTDKAFQSLFLIIVGLIIIFSVSSK